MTNDRDRKAYPIHLNGVELIRELRAREAVKRRDNYYALSALTLAACISYVGYLVLFT